MLVVKITSPSKSDVTSLTESPRKDDYKKNSSKQEIKPTAEVITIDSPACEGKTRKMGQRDKKTTDGEVVDDKKKNNNNLAGTDNRENKDADMDPNRETPTFKNKTISGRVNRGK
jgi:hypothetical protein